MKAVFALPETVVCATLAIVGAYMLKEGIVDRSPNASVLVLGGATFLAVGLVTLEVVVRSLLWHRAMLRSTTNRHRDATREIASNHE